jgi:hypothetical protein
MHFSNSFTKYAKEKADNIYNKSKNTASKAADVTIKASKQYCELKKNANLAIFIIFLIIFLLSLFFFIKSFITTVPKDDINKEKEVSVIKNISGLFAFISFIIAGYCFYNYLLLQTDFGCAQTVISNTTSFGKSLFK